MDTEILAHDWLTKGLMDFEYKKYVLLAYLQRVKQNFESLKLFPSLSDLAFHYKNLQSVKSNKSLLYNQFPKEITRADFKKLKFYYKNIVKDDEIMELIEEILTFAIPKVKVLMTEGRDIYENIEGSVTIEPVGISPLYADEGYVFINETYDREAKIFSYKVSVFESANEKYRGINIAFIKKTRKRIGLSFEKIKLDLIQNNKNLPNPATYLINVDVICPFNETLMPIAKRLLIKYLSTTSESK